MTCKNCEMMKLEIDELVEKFEKDMEYPYYKSDFEISKIEEKIELLKGIKS